ncbi:AAA domain-containing protein [Acholeplasma vituli]|uniref:AAA domain-containing protein n=1 Tax=Paracholeplasma vituli TaxID=69473 RepID=A0ABT2PUI8_9MOLU|nr:AAA domain-containing protein [Paracholeplasma vituli]MCU0104606.1 AAA domain-containing protein [Paracholeplasma vituli]
MALKKNVLLEALDRTREQLRTEFKTPSGETPLICSDEVLKEIAAKKPLKVSDFLGIAGINEDFMSRYATRFLNVIKLYQTVVSEEKEVSKEAFKVLDHYKDRLTNISKTNPNLYIGRLEKSNAFDLTSILNEELHYFLQSPKKTTFHIKIESETHLNHLTTLYREVNKTFKETGSYDLYIATLFLEGIYKKDLFAIKAPLLFIPVKLEREKRTFKLIKDFDKDILLNKDLILAASKMDASNTQVDSVEIKEYSDKVVKEVVIPFYKKHGLDVSAVDLYTYQPFKSELKDVFMKRKKGVFETQNYLLLGRYRLFSSELQKDMALILKQHKYNSLLEGLIEESGLDKPEKALNYALSNTSIKEEKLSYINDLNYAQEKVIDLLNQEKKLVVWGPPGTGKSQTITSLIASSVLKGENVLIVSEKKVALDVIYKRLKSASKYVMFIDDIENKPYFYQKISQILDTTAPKRTVENDIYRLETEINQLLQTMDQALDLMYHQSVQDIPIYQMYERFIKDKDVLNHLSPKAVTAAFTKAFTVLDFNIIKSLEVAFNKDTQLKSYLNYEKMLQNYPVINSLEKAISRSSLNEYQAFNDALTETLALYEKAGAWRKRRLLKTFKQTHFERLSFLSKKKRVAYRFIDTLFKSSEFMNFMQSSLKDLNKLQTKHDHLSKNERSYLSMLLNDPLFRDIEDIHKLRIYIFDALYTGFLEIFKAKNSKYLYIIDEFHQKQAVLQSRIEDKRVLSIESFEMELYKHALDFSNTKRIMEIKRILELDHKPSLKTFISTYQVELLNHVKVWMMTPELVSALLPLQYGIFDLVIFDEASQLYVEKGIPSIYRAKKVVIAGDPKQLRPSALGFGRITDDDELFEQEVFKDIRLDAKSLLDLARYKYKETILNYHYRSTYEELIAFSNHAFYDGKLFVSPNAKPTIIPPIEYVYVKEGTFEKRRNLEEAKSVINLLKKILKDRTNNETIGVITFNSAQRDQIMDLIDQELFKQGVYQSRFEKELFRKEDGEDQSLFVKNIENVQGDERDIIIFSMGYAKNESGIVERRFGWLNHEGGQNRLNVAITRAKQKIYFVSSLLPEEFKVEDLAGLGPRYLKSFMRYCYAVSKKDTLLAKTVLSELHEIPTGEAVLSKFEQDIKDKLEKQGFTIEAKVGIGNYKVDLAIKDSENNLFLMGLLTALDPKDFNSRRDLLHQERFLKSRGWQVYRIFESNWYNNPTSVIKDIKDRIKNNNL